jgi:hypothetical protein
LPVIIRDKLHNPGFCPITAELFPPDHAHYAVCVVNSRPIDFDAVIAPAGVIQIEAN